MGNRVVAIAIALKHQGIDNIVHGAMRQGTVEAYKSSRFAVFYNPWGFV